MKAIALLSLQKVPSGWVSTSEMLDKSSIMVFHLIWKPIQPYIDDIFSLWNADKEEIKDFIVLANRHHLTIKFTAEISNKEVNFVDTTVYKGKRSYNQGILDICTHFKPTETFQYTHFSSCHPAGVRKGLIKGEALRLLRTNSSEKLVDENKTNFKTRL